MTSGGADQHQSQTARTRRGLGFRLTSLNERLRSSLFFVPMAAVAAAIGFGLGSVAFDRRFDQAATDLPLGLTSTVDSARALLSTVAGATIGFAGIAFSVSLLTIQRASSEYSPRVVQTLFRDPFNKRVMALVVGTFTYCLIVVSAVRTPLEDGGDAVIPNLSVAMATIFGVATILAIVAFIDHSARAMDVSEILERVRREATAQIRREWSEPAGRTASSAVPEPGDARCVIRFDQTGWVQLIDVEALLACVPRGATMWIEAAAGRYAVEKTLLATLSDEPEDLDATACGVRDAIYLGDTRTMRQDVSYGLRQLVDVAVKALSPGVNDPTTAQDAIFHVVAVLGELLRREPGDVVHVGSEGRTLVLNQQPTHDDLIRLAFEETRRAAASQPSVCVYLLEALAMLCDALVVDDPVTRTALVRQADLVLAGCAQAGLLAEDLLQVEAAHAKRFGPFGAPP